MLKKTVKHISSSVALPAVVSIAAGTGLCIYLIPEEFHDPKVFVLPAIAQTVGLLLPTLWTFLFKKEEVLRVEGIIALGLVYWLLLDPIQANYSWVGLDRSHIVMSFLAIGVFAGATYIGGQYRPRRFPNLFDFIAKFNIEADYIFYSAVFCFVMTALYYIIPTGLDLGLLYESLFLNRWAAPWMGEPGTWDSFRQHLRYFGHILPTLAVAIAQRKGWRNSLTLTVIVFALLHIVFLAQSGSRQSVGVCIGAALFYFVYSSPKISLLKMSITVILLGASLAFMNLMLTYRNVGWQLARQKGIDPEETLEVLHVDDNLYRLGQHFLIVPNMHPYAGVSVITYALIRVIPRIVWPEKPLVPTFSLHVFLQAQATLSSSVIADWYLVGGWIWILIGGLFYGWLCGICNRLMSSDYRAYNSASILFCLSIMAIFASLRALIDLVLLSYPVLAWAALAYIIRKSKSPLHNVMVHQS